MIGKKVKMVMFIIRDQITFSARIIKQYPEYVVIRIPDKVREMLFTDFPEKAYRVPINTAKKALVQ